MELNYIILAHKSPLQVKRLIDSLQASYSSFFIHIDKNVNIEPFSSLIDSAPNIHFLKDTERRSGVWGDIEIVKGILQAMKKVVRNGNSGYAILLSGQDYPIRKKEDIREFLIGKSPMHFMDFYQKPGNWVGPVEDRIKKYKINKSNKRGHFLMLPSIYDRDFYKLETLGKLNFLRKTKKLKELFKIFYKRKYPEGFTPYGGSVYWALPTITLKKILNLVESNPEYLEFHKYTLCADEIFFHSLIKKLERIEKLEISPSLTYVNWNRKNGPPPVIFKKEDYEELQIASSSKFFARKFDISLDTKILDKLDSK